jgi:SAM-dependent methyltransferase
MNHRERHQENAAAWSVTAAIYERDEEQDIALLKSGGTNLMEPEQRLLGDLSGWCKRAIHLQCSGGLDTLSLWKQGAAEVIGIDISERMIASAQRKSDALNAPASWLCCDVLETPDELNGTADLVHTGRGALLWMMDIDAWARVVERLLKPGGRLHLFEGHPLDWVWETEASEYRFDAKRGNYFTESLSAGEIWPGPFLAEQQEGGGENARLHDRQWTLGAVMNSLVGVGLRLVRFEEHPIPFWNQFPNLPESLLCRLPHTYSLLMQKEEIS